MKKLLFITFILLTISLSSNELDFNSLFDLAKENSKSLKQLSNELRVSEISKNRTEFPDYIDFGLSVRPMLTFDSHGDWGISKGEITLDFNPLHDLTTSISHEFDGGTSLSFLYTLFQSDKDRLIVRNTYDLKKLYIQEEIKSFRINLQTQYSNICYLRSMLKITNLEIDLYKRELVIYENRVKSGLESQFSFDQAKETLLDKEFSMINSEIELLELESRLSTLVGIDISEVEFKPLELPGIDEISTPNRDEILALYRDSFRFNSLKEVVRIREKELKDEYANYFPKISIGSALYTDDFSQVSGSILLNLNLSTIFNKKESIESIKIGVEEAKASLEDDIKEFSDEIDYQFKRAELILKKIDLLNFTLDKANKELELIEYKLNLGEVLPESLDRQQVLIDSLKLQLRHEIEVYILEIHSLVRI
ncbi:TolC family protein [Thiospirochaeta perfilievii]|uniref:TolC family protein n=1 Tax=Thiospirochaeta perfilievii TaxID=252967 RepID=A0A5C1QEM5_9SPIO|nr:TolC family protein [Thiospirochaeta perfilievii]QEN05096.1 TolC family protein [Thiospirochaeta perfilievii]